MTDQQTASEQGNLQATSRWQLAATEAVQVPPFEPVRASTWALPIPMFGTRLPYVISYLLADDRGGLHVIDPGWESEKGWETFVAALTELDRSILDVKSIAITHLHQDHLGLAERLRAKSGARVSMSRVEQSGLCELAGARDNEAWSQKIIEWGVPNEKRLELEELGPATVINHALHADRLLDDGDMLDIPGRRIRVVTTPGHTGGHLCFADLDEGLVFAGDHILPMVYPGLGLGAPTVLNPVGEYLNSVDALAVFDDFEVLPSHGFRFTGLSQRRAQLSEHVLRRAAQVREALAATSNPTVWSIAERLAWSSGWQNLHGQHLRSALAQTLMYMDYVEATE